MTDRTASAGRAAERAKSARRGGRSGRQAVGDYVGQPAGDAAQAVRRAGLRPGLDRSFGCAEELIGLVVAQEPTAGSSMARNGMVTLYVAAPGSEPIDEGTDAAQVESGGPEPAAVASVEEGQAGAASAPARVRRRKRGRARRAAPVVDAPPAPAPADRASAAELPTVVLAQPAVGPASGWQPVPGEPDSEPLDDEVPEDAREDALSDEEFVVHVEDVLAGRSGPVRWRGCIRAGARSASWAPAAVFVDGCASIGWQAALSAPRSCCGRSSASLLRWTASTRTRRLGARSRAAGGPPRGIGCRRRSERLRPARGRCARRRDPLPAPRSHVLCFARGGGAGSGSRQGDGRAARRGSRRAPVPQAPPVAAPVPAAAPPASAPPAAAPEQTGGGLFSP